MTLDNVGRRDFLKAAGAGLLIIKPELVRGTQANSAVRVGLLGCGGRGTEVATGMAKNAGARIAALGDMFEDQLTKAKAHFDTLATVESSQLFSGPHAYEKMAASKEIDAIYIATPPFYHTEHLAAVVNAGKHAYCEKPVGVDVFSAKRAIAIGKKAEGKLSLDVGFQIRQATPYVELVRRIHAGELGEITCGQAYYFAGFIDRPEWPNASPTMLRLRNWIYDRVLSGDIIVEQNIHVIDICNWIMNGHPVKAVGSGGRRGRNDSGNVYSHFDMVFTYPNDVHVSFASTQFGKDYFDANEKFFGAKGTSESPYSGRLGIFGGTNPWTYSSGAPQQQQGGFSATGAFSDNLADADPQKQKSWIESIQSGKFHNQAELGAQSALSCMMGRTAAYTGRPVTWDELLKSDEKWESGINLEKLT
jgi:myo-inositol 2-dehydrogenase / D-chiro-inositol 1-dehydrogenase